MFIMLGKSLNNISVSKLRVILLLEVNFNIVNKIIFNIMLILTLETMKSISRELMGERRG